MGSAAFAILKENRRVLLSNLQISGKLNSYLADIDRQAEEMFEWLVKQMAERESVTEKLKGTDQMKCVQCMNRIRNQASEIVNSEIIDA